MCISTRKNHFSLTWVLQGNDFTFGDFPDHLKKTVANNLPEHEVASVVYPKYETRGELAQSTAAFLEWYVYPTFSCSLLKF